MINRKIEIKHFRDLDVYQKAFTVAMKIYEITKDFPEEEKYSLTHQIRKASRSACSNIAESWRKRLNFLISCYKRTIVLSFIE